jgi:hypothetical protein
MGLIGKKKGGMNNQPALVAMKRHGSGRFNHRAGTDTAGADIDPHRAASGIDRPHILQVRQPTAAGLVVGMTDIVAGYRPFSTNIAYACHEYISLYKVIFLKKLI